MKNIRNAFLCLLLALVAIVPNAALAQGTTVIPGLGPGLGQSVNPFDPAYQKQALIAKNTQIADQANSAAATAYLLKSQDWLVNAVAARDSGQPIPPITDPPLKIHVDQATGSQTSGPDAVASKPVLPAPSTPAPGSTSNGLIANPNAPPDRLDQIMAGLAQMYNMLAAIKAKLGIQ